MKDRQRQIDAGKLWQVCECQDLDKVMFEGSKTACLKYMKQTGHFQAWSKGKGVVSLCKMLYEAAPEINS